METRFCRSADGTRIAFGVGRRGGERHMLNVVGWPSILGDSAHQRWAETFRDHTLIYFDRRGLGSSARDVTDISLERQAEDALAVIDAAGAERVDIHSSWDGTPIAIALAAEHPARVSRMALGGPYVRGADVISRAALQSTMETARSNWSLMRRSLANIGGRSGDDAQEYHELLRQGATPDMAARYIELYGTIDCDAYVDRVAAPTLVVHRPSDGAVPRAASQEVASRIPGARFVTLAQRDERNAALREFFDAAVRDFFAGERVAPERRAAAATPRAGTVVILFADIADSTAITERVGDHAFRDRARDLDGRLRSIISEHGGSAVDGKLLGDGVLSTFGAARDAIGAALACAQAAQVCGLALHLGAHAGDVIQEGDNVFGGAVNIAARIAAISAPGELLVSDVVRVLARTSAGVGFDDRGEHSLKGIEDAQRVFSVRRNQALEPSEPPPTRVD